jgi:ATP-dependent helicase/DNAse subunit B
MQELYTPYIGKNITESVVQTLLSNVNDDAFWTTLSPLQDLNGDVLAELVVRTYVNNILNYDFVNTPFQFLHAEVPIEAQLPNGITIVGKVDRVDSKAGIVRVIDYKTGAADLDFKTMAEVFGVSANSQEGEYVIRKQGKGYVLQTMLYSWVLSEKYPNIAPYIFPARKLSDTTTNTSILQTYSDNHQVFDDASKTEFINELTKLVDEIRNVNIPFCPAEKDHPCSYCSFVELCGRQLKK